MTALCGGAASQARPGVVGNAFSTAAGITSYLSTFLPLPIAIGIGAIAALETFDVAQYCATDPPADPGLVPSDFTDILNPGDLTHYLPAVTKVRLWWRHVYWWQVCECVGVATPPLPPPSSPGNQSSNPGLPSGGSSTCYTSDAGYNTVGLTSGFTPLDLTSIWMPPTTDTISVSASFQGHTVTGRAFRVPQNVQYILFTAHNRGAISPPPVNAVDASVLLYNASGTIVDAQQMLTTQDVQTGRGKPGIPVPTTPTYVAILGINTADTSVAGKVVTWDVSFAFTCAGDGISSPCCPPDPSLELKINQALQLLIDLSSRSSTGSPISWHDGNRHSGLRGAGSFLIDAKAIGIRFEVTTPPSGTKVDPGQPDFYWDMGFWTPFALTSPLRGGRLVFLKQSVELPEFTDQIGYTLKHGTILDAVELLPTS